MNCYHSVGSYVHVSHIKAYREGGQEMRECKKDKHTLNKCQLSFMTAQCISEHFKMLQRHHQAACVSKLLQLLYGTWNFIFSYMFIIFIYYKHFNNKKLNNYHISNFYFPSHLSAVPKIYPLFFLLHIQINYSFPHLFCICLVLGILRWSLKKEPLSWNILTKIVATF